MNLKKPNDHLFVPDGTPAASALQRITHLGIGARHDDLKFMGFQGMLECLASDVRKKLSQRPGNH